MYVKMMHDWDLPDSDPRKAYRMFDRVQSLEFERTTAPKDAIGSLAVMTFENGDRVKEKVAGNVYVMDERTGKTVATYSPNALPASIEPASYYREIEVGMPEEVGPDDAPSMSA